MARKFLLVPEQQYRDLTSLSDSNNEILAGARGHMERLMNDRKLNVSQKKALFNQQLKGFLRLRKDAVEKPVKVEIAGGPKMLLGRDGAVAFTDAEAEEPEEVEQSVPGANLLKPTTTPADPKTPPRRNRKRRNPTPQQQQDTFSEDDAFIYRNRGTNRTQAMAQEEDILKEAYTNHFERLAKIITDNRAQFGVDEHGQILNTKKEPIVHSDFRDALASILKKDVVGVTVVESTPVGTGQLKKALKSNAATKNLLNKDALLDAAESQVPAGSMEQTALLRRLYNDPSSAAGFAGVDSLYAEARKRQPTITRAAVQHFLEGDRTYSLFRPTRNRYPRLRTVPAGFLTDVQVDLADLQKLAEYNGGYRYILVAVDVLSRRIFVVPTRSKSTTHMKDAFEKLFRLLPHQPWKLHSDKGVEFESKQMKAYFKQRDILKCSPSNGDVKCAVVERFIRTLKQRLYRYFNQNNTQKWTDVVQEIADGMNHARCRVTGMRPVDVNHANAEKVWNHVYGSTRKSFDKPSKRFTVNTPVRIDKAKGAFHKSYLPGYTDEVFKINTIYPGRPISYTIRGEDGEPILGKFFKQNFSKTRPDEDSTLRIEKVLHTRRRNGATEYNVKFVGVPEDLSSWITQKELV